MKLLFKILFFVVAILQTNISEAKAFVSGEVVTQIRFIENAIDYKNEVTINVENDIAITCKSQSDLLAYRSWPVSVGAVAAKGVGNFAYRSLTSANAESLAAGNGIFAKAPGGFWTLEQHLIQGSSPKSFLNNPWIATSTDIYVARSFSSGNGLIRIDLSKLPAGSMQQGGYLQLISKRGLSSKNIKPSGLQISYKKEQMLGEKKST